MKTIMTMASFLIIGMGSVLFINMRPVQVYSSVKWLGVVDFKVVDEKTNEALNKNVELIVGEGALEVKSSVVLKYGVYTCSIDETLYEFKVTEPRNHVVLEVNVPDYVKDYHIEDKMYVYDVVELSVPLVYQKPELPNGCEITSLTSLLRFYDYDVSKLEMAEYLDNEAFYYKKDKRYGADPNKAFAGDPKKSSGWYVFEAPIIKAGNQVLDEDELQKTSEIMRHLVEGRPVMVWTTLDMSSISYGSGWYLEDDSHYKAIRNLHCIVVHGYDESDFYVMDPLQGFVKIKRDVLMNSFIEMGSRGIVLLKNE